MSAMSDDPAGAAAASSDAKAAPADAPAAEAGESADTQNLFEVRAWKAVAVWSWDLAIETCAICT